MDDTEFVALVIESIYLRTQSLKTYEKTDLFQHILDRSLKRFGRLCVVKHHLTKKRKRGLVAL